MKGRNVSTFYKLDSLNYKIIIYLRGKHFFLCCHSCTGCRVCRLHSSCVLRSYQQIVPRELQRGVETREVYINSLAIIINCDFALFSLTHILDPTLVSCKCKCQFTIYELVNLAGWTTRGIDREKFRRRKGDNGSSIYPASLLNVNFSPQYIS